MKAHHIPRGSTVVSEQPYRFIRPHRSQFWPWIFAPFVPRLLARKHGITSWEVAGAEHVRASQQAGHGVLIVPNHPSPSDPVVLGLAARALHCNLHVMASAHVFQQSRFMRWLLPRLGVFSVYREGMDREALKVAIEILASAQRPLVIFGEGVITRTNDRLVPLQDGLSFIARAAAKAAAERRPGGRVVVHALALRYRFHGDVDAVLRPPLERIERRLSWQPQRDLTTPERIIKIGHALLALKEVEYFGVPGIGEIRERLHRLLDRVLLPIENEWVGGRNSGTVIQRVKTLRKAILPEMIAGDVGEAERARRWRHLYDLQLAEQLFHFPSDYLGATPSADRLIETVHRYAEAIEDPDLFVASPMTVRMEFGPAIAVETVRDRKAPTDPLVNDVTCSLAALLGLSKGAFA